MGQGQRELIGWNYLLIVLHGPLNTYVGYRLDTVDHTRSLMNDVLGCTALVLYLRTLADFPVLVRALQAVEITDSW
jgi:hypothetical protein